MRHWRILAISLALGPAGCGSDATAPEIPTAFDVTVEWPYALEAGFETPTWTAVAPAEAAHVASALAEGRFDASGVATLRFTAACRPGDASTYPQARLSGSRAVEEEPLLGPCTVSLILGCSEEALRLAVPDPADPWVDSWDDRTTTRYHGSCPLFPSTDAARTGVRRIVREVAAPKEVTR